MSKLLGLNGKMGVGKSEALKTLNEISEAKVVNVKFAQPIYDIQEYIYNRIQAAYSRPETFIKDRKLLQWIGTEWGRNSISSNLWVDLWAAEVKRNLDLGYLVVCDDVRFDNEAEVIKNLGGKILQITSTRTDERIDTRSGLTNHASEAGIGNKYVDMLVENNSSLIDYKNSLAYAFGMMGIGDSMTENSV